MQIDYKNGPRPRKSVTHWDVDFRPSKVTTSPGQTEPHSAGVEDAGFLPTADFSFFLACARARERHWPQRR